MDFLVRWIASLFEAFKLKNPVIAGVLLLILSAIIHTASQGTVLGLFTLPSWASDVIQYISLFFLSVTGSQTYRYLPAKVQETARQ